MARYPKIRRKDLRKPDEFLSFSRRAVEFASANARALGGAAIILFLMLGTVVGLSIWRHMQQTAASVAFTAARELFIADNLLPARDYFQRIADEYSGTTYGPLALLYAADCSLAAGLKQEALKMYQQFLDTGPDLNYLRQTALVRLGRAQEATGDFAAARKTYQEAEQTPGPFAPDVLLGQARVEAALGHTKLADRLYRQFLDSFPDSQMATAVQAKLSAQTAVSPQG